MTNFEKQRSYNQQSRFNSAYSRNNLLQIKDEIYVTNFDGCELIATHSIAFYLTVNNVTYFDSFGVEDIPWEIKKFVGNNNTQCEIQLEIYNSIMCVYFCIGFIDYILKGKSLLDYTNMFSNSQFEKNDKMILKYF